MDINEQRFWKKVKKTPNCWIWTGAIKPDMGYGRMYVNKKAQYPHRYSYELKFGSIPKGLCVCHKCDVRSCVNPEHLFLGTIIDNIKDMVSKNRNARGKMLPHTILDEDKVREIRRKHALGQPSKEICKIYGCSRQNINDITSFRTWKHV